MTLHIDVISIFPDMFSPALSLGMPGRAFAKGLAALHVTDLRDFTTDKHRSTDDAPYGGGSGMVMLVEPLVRALSAIERIRGRGHRVLLTPVGQPLRQQHVQALAKQAHLVLLCGRYEGIDERITHYIDEEISIGDFVLSGGELPAMALIDAVTRLLPGVLNNENSPVEESFQHGLLEYPQYTRPAEYEGHPVPPVLLSGNHELVRLWRRQMSLLRTLDRRPELFARLPLTEEDRKLLGDIGRTALVGDTQ
jgi:tRNA (guanine37-N1)-methyltransferase